VIATAIVTVITIVIGNRHRIIIYVTSMAKRSGDYGSYGSAVRGIA
jgi:hypothetical protein